MKKKNIYRALLVTSALSLTGLKEQNLFAKENDSVMEMETEEDLVKKEREKWENFAEEISKNESMYLDYSGGYNLCLYNKYRYEGKKELSEEFYTNLNILLENTDITRLYFRNVDDRFDFSKVNLSNIEDLALDIENYEGTLPESIFDQTFSELYFHNASLEVATELMKNCVSKDAWVVWDEKIEKQSNFKELLEFLTEEKVEFRSFSVWQINEQDYLGITKEELELLGELQVSSIDVTVDGINEPLNVDIELNKKIEDFDLFPYQNYYDGINGELGNVKIRSSNEKLTCWFCHIDITKNTRFSLPDSITVKSSDLSIKDTTAIRGLRNVQNLFLGEFSYTPGISPEDIGCIEYNKDEYNKDDGPFGNRTIGQYTNFQEMLTYLESYVQLLKVREMLEVSPNEGSRYKDILSIGDIVNLNSEDAIVFENKKDLQNQENGKSSYYGTSELRCVSSLHMTNGEKNVEVYNMDDYEYYIDEGFVVTGSDLVNQYSLCSNGELTPEGCYKNTSLQLVLVPFK